MLRIDAREFKGLFVLDLKGRLDLGMPVTLLGQHIQRAVEQKEPRILLNLQDVTYIDSMGLGELVASYTTVKKRGGDLALAAPNELVSSVLKVTRLPNVIKVYDSVDQALADVSQ